MPQKAERDGKPDEKKRKERQEAWRSDAVADVERPRHWGEVSALAGHVQ
jgi:hypothetical protein